MGTVKYSGPIASFHCPTNAEIRSLKVHFSPKQEGSGDPSPENVRPIVGWDGVIAGQSGKNCIDESFLSDASNYAVPGAYAYIYTEYLYLAPNTKYRFVWFNTNDIAMGYANLYCDGAGEYIVNNGRYRQYPNGFTTDETGKIRFGINKSSAYNTVQEALDAIFSNGKLLLQVGVEDIPYESYRGSTANYEFGVLGKNKLNNDDEFWEVGSMSSYGEKDSRTTRIRTKDFIPVLPNTVYTISISEGYSFAWNEFYSGTHKYYYGWQTDSYTFTTHSDVNQLFFIIKKDNTTNISPSILENDCHIQLELGSTATAYEPYDPNKTVYGGWVDLVTGEVCAEYEKKVLDGSENWALNVWSKNGIYLNNREDFNNRIIPYQSSTADKMYCNILDSVNSTYYLKTDKAFSIVGGDYVPNYTYLLLYNSEWGQTVEEYKVALKALYDNGTPVEVIAPLKTDFQQTYHLSPHSTALKTFLSQNNVWSNADYVEVEYDLHETQNILARKQFIIASQPHVEKLAAVPLQNFVTDMAAPLKECKVYFNPVQEGSGDPSPDNVRAISGWNQVEVYRTGKNLCPAATSTEMYENWEYYESGRNYIIQGLPPGQAMTLQCNLLEDRGENISNLRLYLRGSNYGFINTATPAGVKSLTRNVNVDGSIRISHNNLGLSPTSYNVQFNNTQLEVGSEATAYEPYTGTTIPITFPPVINMLNSTTITANKTLSAAGEETSESGMSLTDYIKVNEGDTYKLTFTSKEGARTRRIWSYNANKEPIEQLASTSWVTVDTVGSIQATIPSGAEYIRICYKTADENIFLEGPESSVIYGGYVDLIKCELVQEWQKVKISDLTWNNYSSKIHYYAGLGSRRTNTRIYSDTLVTRDTGQFSIEDVGELTYFGEGTTNTYRYVWTKLPSAMEHSDANAWIKSTYPDASICYKLQTPIHYQLDPTVLKTLKGINNIWSDANGQIELSYWTH